MAIGKQKGSFSDECDKGSAHSLYK